jgi:hypothetical protein
MKFKKQDILACTGGQIYFAEEDPVSPDPENSDSEMEKKNLTAKENCTCGCQQCNSKSI